jgi:hypothetical protein
LKFTFTMSAALFAACSTLAACTTADPTVYAGLTSASQLRPNTEDKSGKVPYRYVGDADWRQYNRAIIDPVTIYRGPDDQFVKVTDQEKALLADYMHTQFTEKLKSRFAVVTSPAAGSLRIHLTLTGAKTTTPVLGPFSHIDVGGGVYNVVQAARDKEGSLTGSVSYAVEIYDATDNRLLSAYVTKQYPNALNAGASFGALSASKVGIRKGADALLAQFTR